MKLFAHHPTLQVQYHNSHLSDRDIQINHRLLSEEGKKSLTIVDRYHLVRCYLITALFGLIFNSFIPVMAAVAKFCAEGHCPIDNLTVLGWSPDQNTCWYLAAALGLASMLKVFSLAREQFTGAVGFVTTFILCVGLEWQWIIFKPAWEWSMVYGLNVLVTVGVFSFVVAANAFSGASALAIRERESELRFNQTLNENLATRAAALEAREEVRREYDASLEDVLQKGTSQNNKMSLKVFRVVNGDEVEYWLGPDGETLRIRLADPNLPCSLTAQRPKVSQDRRQHSPTQRTPGPKSTTPPAPESQKTTNEAGDDPNDGTDGATSAPTAAATTNTKNRR